VVWCPPAQKSDELANALLIQHGRVQAHLEDLAPPLAAGIT
jgi:hypothetical protein